MSLHFWFFGVILERVTPLTLVVFSSQVKPGVTLEDRKRHHIGSDDSGTNVIYTGPSIFRVYLSTFEYILDTFLSTLGPHAFVFPLVGIDIIQLARSLLNRIYQPFRLSCNGVRRELSADDFTSDLMISPLLYL